MRSKILVPLLAASFAVPAAVLATPASADTAGCVTKTEFRAVSKGWSITRVYNRFDTHGHQTYFIGGSKYFPAEQGREYKSCTDPSFSTVEVDYKKRDGVWRVSDRFAYWG